MFHNRFTWSFSDGTRAARGALRASILTLALAAGASACGETRNPADRAAPAVPAGADAGARQLVVLTPEADSTAGIRVTAARENRAGAAPQSLQAPGQVEMDPRRVAVASSRIPARIERLLVVEGDEVRQAQPVAELFNAAFVAAQGELLHAERRARALASSPDSIGSRALADAAARRLALMGASESEIDAWRRGESPSPNLVLRAPLDGSVLQAHALAGMAVEAGTPLFTIADLSVVDVVAEIPEVSLPLVRVGQPAVISIAAFPSLRFAGTVERLRNALNPDTRTVRAVIHVPNAARSLRPGMYASVSLQVSGGAGGGTRPAGVLVPESAIVTDGDARVAFVEVAPRSYERRVVRVESLAPAGAMYPAGADVLVVRGLRPGDRVVVHGAFLLKAELAKRAPAEDR